MTATEAFKEIERREISITGWRNRRIWVASVEVEIDGRQGRKGRPDLRIVSAMGNAPLAAVEALVAKLEANKPTSHQVAAGAKVD